MTGWQDDLNNSTQAFLDQFLLRTGKAEHRGWLKYRDLTQADNGKKAFFILRGSWMVYYEGEIMDDPGVRLINVSGCRVMRSGRGFLVEDQQQRKVQFECGVHGEIDTDKPLSFPHADIAGWLAAIADKGATVDNPPAGTHPGADGGAPAAPAPPRAAAPPPPAAAAFPHISPTGGGKEYTPAEYDGGADIIEPAPLLNGEFLKPDAEWRCWPSGPLPPNPSILSTEQNRETWAAAEGSSHVWVPSAVDEFGRAGIGLVLKQAYQGIAITEGNFAVQVGDVPFGGAAYDAKQDGLLKIGDFLLEIDGWSTAERKLNECAERLVGRPGTQVKITVGHLATPRFFGQPNVWCQAGVLRQELRLIRGPSSRAGQQCVIS